MSVLEVIAKKTHIVVQMRDLSRVDNIRSAAAIGRQWLIIIAVAFLAVKSGYAVADIVAIMVIATRQHALSILFHDAAHYRLFSGRQVNDFISDVFCALPGGLLTSRYRYEHLQHHRAPNTTDDPYLRIFRANPATWQWPKARREGFVVLLKDLLGLSTAQNVREIWYWLPWSNHFSTRELPLPLSVRERATVYIFFLSLALALLAGLWWWLILFWLLPLTTVTQVLIRIRAIAEHFGMPVESGTDATRHVDATWYERLTVCPLNVNYHLAHHIFPSVPYFNLPRLNRILFSEPEFSRAAHRSSSYLSANGVLRRELTKI